MPCVFNAANEWANAAFRRGQIRFLDIYRVIEDVMGRHGVTAAPSVEEIQEIANETFEYCEKKYQK
jgi:1-deoxy-D-xylulose-5-phosphate reductoisomerase